MPFHHCENEIRLLLKVDTRSDMSPPQTKFISCSVNVELSLFFFLHFACFDTFYVCVFNDIEK